MSCNYCERKEVGGKLLVEIEEFKKGKEKKRRSGFYNGGYGGGG